MAFDADQQSQRLEVTISASYSVLRLSGLDWHGGVSAARPLNAHLESVNSGVRTVMGIPSASDLGLEKRAS